MLLTDGEYGSGNSGGGSLASQINRRLGISTARSSASRNRTIINRVRVRNSRARSAFQRSQVFSNQ